MVALAQAVFHAGQRSRCLASITKAIVAAAEHDPSPDLIVLPDCRELHLTVAGEILHTPAMCQGFSEALSLLAREWGVWIAAGHDVCAGGRIVAGATLFDPDGDPYIRHPSDRQVAAWDKDDDFAAGYTARRTPLGLLALFVSDSKNPESPVRLEVTEAMDLLIIPGAESGSAPSFDVISEWARTLHAFICAVYRHQSGSGTTGPTRAPGAIVGRTGDVVALLAPGAPGFGMAALDITPAPMPAGGELEGIWSH